MSDFTEHLSVIEASWSIEELTPELKDAIKEIILSHSSQIMTEMLKLRNIQAVDPAVFTTTFTTQKDFYQQQVRLNTRRGKLKTKCQLWWRDKRKKKSH